MYALNNAKSYKLYRFLGLLFLLPQVLWVFLGPAQAEPMSFRLAGNGGNCNGCEWVSAQGEITDETPQAFREYVQSNGTPFNIALHSPGGSLAAGMELGRLIRETGATTFVAKTVQMLEEGLEHYEETEEGICASSCAFAFMGGTERFVDDDGKLGVHQFYSRGEDEVPSEIVQVLAGLTLFHTIEMGVDPRVIVAASGTASDQIYWFDKEELVTFGLDTSISRTEPWKLEPYKSGVVLNTVQHETVRRSVSITLFCRVDDHRWHMLVAEESPHYAEQLADGDFFGFSEDYPSRPTLTVGKTSYAVHARNVEFQRVSENNILVSVDLPSNVADTAGQSLRFDPDLARVFGSLLRVDVELPPRDWLILSEHNCI